MNSSINNLNESLLQGRQTFQSIPEQLRVDWCAEILSLIVTDFHDVPEPITNLLHLMRNGSDFDSAHKMFNDIRSFSLNNPSFKPQNLLSFAEQIAKVLYNLTEPIAPFDANSGWKIEYFANQLGYELNEGGISKRKNNEMPT